VTRQKAGQDARSAPNMSISAIAVPSCLEQINFVTSASKYTLTAGLRQTWMVKNGSNAPNVKSGTIPSARKPWVKTQRS